MQTKHAAKKYAVISVGLFTLALTLAAGSPSLAVFTPGTSVTKSATATLAGAGTVSMSVAVKKVSDNSAATDLAWTGVTLPTGWKNSDHYVQLDSTITASNGGIRIVTDNRGAGASPTQTGSTTTVAGLVDNTDTTKTLPVAWTVKDSLVGPTGPASAKPYEATDGAGQANQFQWLYMTDAFDGSLAPGAPYRTVVNVAGIHFGGGDTEFGGAVSPNFVYVEANFATAVTPRTYSTNKLIVEAFTQ